MSDFAARVDAALPVSGLIGKGGTKLPGVKVPRTKMERKMQKMQKEWREVEARRREKREEAMEEVEDEDGDMKINARGLNPSQSSKKGKRRIDDDDEDPWAAVGKSQSTKTTSPSAGLVGLHDVVQAPPQFSKVPTDRFRIRNGAKISVLDVPGAAGSLRRREELGEARRSVVEGYRAMMKEKKAGDGG